MEVSAAKFRALLASLKSDAPPDNQNRKQPRVGLRGMVNVVLLTPNAPPSRPLAVRLVDVSAGGLSFLFPEALKDKQVVEVRLPKVGGYDAIVCIVRHSRRSADGLYSIGVQFGRMPAAAAPVPQAKAS